MSPQNEENALLIIHKNNLTLKRPDVQNFHVDYNVVPFKEKR